MKTKLTMLLIVASTVVFAQKKKNGNVYKEHPAINVINEMYAAVNKNDLEKLDDLIADGFKGMNGDGMNKDAEPFTKEEFIKNINNWNTSNRYFSLKSGANAYPDAVEYKDENFKKMTWVYAWEVMSGVGGKTGVKFSQPRHAQYVVTPENKIGFVRLYMNQNPFSESWRSRKELSDGTIYSNHPNINTVRKAIHALQYGNLDHFFEAFSADAKFDGLFNDWDSEALSMEEFKAMQAEFLNNFSIESLDNKWIKYYEFESQANYVQSWWRLTLKRKSNKELITIPVMLNHRFNNDGKIVKSNELWNEAKL
jgi:hypothetical protein